MTQLFLDQLNSEGRLVLTVRVHPHAKQTTIKEMMADGSLKIDIRAAAEDGRANEELCKFIAQLFGLHTKEIKILSGHHSRKKMIAVTREKS